MENALQPCHIPGMAKHPKRPRDTNQLAKLMVDILTGQVEDREQPAVSRGRKGGLKGGKARAESMTAEERSASAKKAVMARWRKSGNDA